MKTGYFGWETVHMNGNTVNWSSPLQGPITLRGYSITISTDVTSPASGFAEILFQAAFGDKGSNADFGPITKDPDVNGYGVQNGVFCVSIIKTWAPAAVNQVLTQSNLDIALPPGTPFTMLAQHWGVALDFEVAGVLYYE